MWCRRSRLCFVSSAIDHATILLDLQPLALWQVYRDNMLLFKIREINTKYKKLEEEYIKKRTQSKSDLTTFAEVDVGTRLAELTNHRKRIVTMLKNNNKVSIETIELVL